MQAQNVVTTAEDNEEEVFEDEEGPEDDDEEPTGDDETGGATVSVIGGVEQTEGMNANIDSLLHQWHAQNHIEQGTDSRDLYPAEPILADSATYAERLRRLPLAMNLPYNDIVKLYIEQYAGRLRRSVSYMLGAGNFYIPLFEEALDAHGLPLELKYLPVIESALNPNAVSRVGATGLWQFMPATAKRYGLEINSLTDERRDPIKSSWAAARYLKELYDIFQDWPLVIAAYNCGPTNVNKAIHRAGDTRDYWKIYPYLPRETRGYVPAFTAANYIMAYYCEHGIHPMSATLPDATDTVQVSRDLHLRQVADLCQTDIEELRALNPQYRRDIVPGLWQTSTLRLPQEAVGRFIAAGDSLYAHRAGELLPRQSTNTVNDTYIPAPAPKGSVRHGKHKARDRKGRSRYATVRRGDTLSSIARRHGITVKQLKRINGISGSNIRAGKKLRVK